MNLPGKVQFALRFKGWKAANRVKNEQRAIPGGVGSQGLRRKRAGLFCELKEEPQGWKLVSHGERDLGEAKRWARG